MPKTTRNPQTATSTSISKPLTITSKSNKPPKSIVSPTQTSMTTSDTNVEFLRELGVDLSTLSDQNMALVHVLIGGIRKLLDRQFEVERQNCQAKIDEMESKITKLQDRYDDLENYGRRNTIVISGTSLPDVTRDENCITLATDIIKNRLGIQDFNHSDIDVAHRLGKPRSGTADKRNFIVKLIRRENKRRIFSACRIKKPQNLYINESVSKTRSSILYVLRRASKDYPTKFGPCTTEDGNVRVRLPTPEDPSRFIKETVNTRDALDRLLRLRTNHDSEKYEPRWTA